MLLTLLCMELLKRHLPFPGQEGVEGLKQIAIRFEEKIYTEAVSQPDYLRRISLKMVSMESKSQSTLPGAVPSNSAGRNPQEPGSSFSSLGKVEECKKFLTRCIDLSILWERMLSPMWLFWMALLWELVVVFLFQECSN